MTVIILKKSYDSLKYGKTTKIVRLEITGSSPFVENFVKIKEKKKEGSM